ncbi:MAG: hypothetical protein WBL61_23685 [Bryobacteraceae bacterium]
MISALQNTESLTRLGMLKFFPVKENVLAEIGKLLNELCRNDHEAKRLTGLVLARWSEWQGPSKLKALFDTEIASQRPREAQPAGCDKCAGSGLRQVFLTFETIPGAAEEKRVHYPEGDSVLRFEQALYGQCAKSGARGPYSAVMACDCPLGQVRRAESGKPNTERE